MKIERDQHNQVTIITLDTGIKLDLHDPHESLSIDTPVRMWDVVVAHGRLKLDGHDVEELIMKERYRNLIAPSAPPRYTAYEVPL